MRTDKRLGGILLLVLFLLTIIGAGCGSDQAAKPAEKHFVTDAQGTKVEVPAKAQRIMTYSMSMDEIVLGLVEPERMISVDELHTDPMRSNVAALAQRVPNAIPRMPSVEKAASMKPDLIFTVPFMPAEQVDALRALGIPVVACRQVRNLDDVIYNIRLAADAVGEPERGAKLVEMMMAELAALKARVDAVPEEERGKSVAFISIMAGYGGAGCSFDVMCDYAGAINAKAAAGNKSGTVITKEQLVAANPDYIFLPSYRIPSSNEETYGREYMSDPSLAQMTAVREGHIKHPWGHYVYNGSQNIVFGAQETAAMLYGDAFAQPTNRHLTAVEGE